MSDISLAGWQKILLLFTVNGAGGQVFYFSFAVCRLLGSLVRAIGKCLVFPGKSGSSSVTRSTLSQGTIPMGEYGGQWAPIPWNPSSGPSRCFDERISQICLCVEQGILCWIIAVQLVTSKGEIRGPSHAAMLWRSLSKM